MRMLLQVLIAFAFMAGTATAQYGHILTSLEWLVSDADLVVRGSVVEVDAPKGRDGEWLWLDVTLKVEETLKGAPQKRVRLAIKTTKGDERWGQFVESCQEQLWFLVNSEQAVQGEDPNEAAIRAQHPFKIANYLARCRLGPEVAAEAGYASRHPPIFTMNFDLLEKQEQILAGARATIAAEPKERHPKHSIKIPHILANRTGASGDTNSFEVPADRRLEALALRLIDAPEVLLSTGKKEADANPRQQKSEEDRLRAEGAKALRFFKSEENVERLKALLDHPAVIGKSGTEEIEYFVRKEAYGVLIEWEVAVEKPVIVETRKSP